MTWRLDGQASTKGHEGSPCAFRLWEWLWAIMDSLIHSPSDYWSMPTAIDSERVLTWEDVRWTVCTQRLGTDPGDD